MSTSNGATATAGANQSTSSPSAEDQSSKLTLSSATANDAPTSSPSDGTTAVTAATDEEEDLAKLQAEIAKMEEEAARIAQETADLEKGKSLKTNGIAAAGGQAGVDGEAAAGGAADGVSRDGLSIYVGQVEYTSKPEELCAHFEPCGTVERVTIVCDKFSGKPKGFAYLEFQSEEGVENAVKLDGSTFKGRTLKVTHKRVNDPNYHYNQAAAGGRGSGGRGSRGRFGGGR